MEEPDDFKYDIVFNSISYNIKCKRDLNKNSKIYIDWAKELFQNITKSLDSILDTNEDKAYHITPHLKEIIKCAGKASSINPQDVIELKEKFSSIVNKLDNLKKDPHKFYETKDSEEILDFFEKLIPIYDIMKD